MRLGKQLTAPFYLRCAIDVARELIGCTLVRRLPTGEEVAGRLVEVEAYMGDGSDLGSHSHRGPTPRNRAMFGPPGHLYAYRIYGIHTCVNAVCEPEGIGAAVLLRAVEPIQGSAWMRANRGLPENAQGRILASGPGRLAQAFGLGLESNHRSLLTRELALYQPPEKISSDSVGRGPRIGISKATEFPYRFYLKRNFWVSGPRAISR